MPPRPPEFDGCARSPLLVCPGAFYFAWGCFRDFRRCIASVAGKQGIRTPRTVPRSAPAHTAPIILPENTTLCFNPQNKVGTMRVRRLDHVLLAMPAGRE